MSEDFFLGASDIAAGDIPGTFEMQKKHRSLYEEDLKKYGKELSKEDARDEINRIERASREWASEILKDKVPEEDLRYKLISKTAEEDGIHAVKLVLRALETERGELPRKFWDPVEETIEDDMSLGNYAELVYAEPLASIRLCHRRRGYVIMGDPDGIGQNFLYEFKETRRPTIEPQRRLAIRQGAIYGYIFGITNLRVEIVRYYFSGYPFPINPKSLPVPHSSRFEIAINFKRIEMVIDNFINKINQKRGLDTNE